MGQLAAFVPASKQGPSTTRQRGTCPTMIWFASKEAAIVSKKPWEQGAMKASHAKAICKTILHRFAANCQDANPRDFMELQAR